MLRVSVAAAVALFCVASSHAQMQHGQMQQGAPAASVFKIGDLTIETPWLRATPQGAKVAGGYMKIVNNGKEADRLTGGTIERAGRFEVHEMSMAGNVMQMRPLPDGLEIKPGASVELKPGGFHIMGMDLQSGYAAGQIVKGTLTFAKAGTVAIEYKVAPIGAGAPSHGH
jgi:copper(I)-binding protein